MKLIAQLFNFTLATLLTGLLLVASALLLAWHFLDAELPTTDVLRDIQLQVPLRIYSSEGGLIAEYGQKRREPVELESVPQTMLHAVLAVEDANFYSHPGVDYRGIIRAVVSLAQTGERQQGGSTITMQLARNFFLSPEKSYIRKVREIMLAMHIEENYSKDEIFTLYLNKIYFGKRAYGVKAAAHAYYGKELEQLTLAETAMIAGLPKAPSSHNPLTNPEGAVNRRNHVLNRMHLLGYIDDAELDIATKSPITARAFAPRAELEAAYVGEMVRAEMVERYGEEAYTGGYHVYTTIKPALQRLANHALRGALDVYDKRHGYRGPEQQLKQEIWSDPARRRQLLRETGRIGQLQPAIVLGFPEKQSMEVALADGSTATIDWKGLKWARRYRGPDSMNRRPREASEIAAPGDLVRLLPVTTEEESYLRLAQIPATQGALVSIDPNSGEVFALTGGYEYYDSKFNRATQAKRQPGSGFKPFIYSAALAAGYQPSSIIQDAPISIRDDNLPGGYWRPSNYNKKFSGPTPIRKGLAFSKNLVSIRLLRSIGTDYAREHIYNFGFDTDKLPKGLTLALGTGEVTPYEMAGAYSAFANGGFRVTPHVIERVEQPGRGVVFRGQNQIQIAISAENRFLMYSMMKDVIRIGTGRKALALERPDIAGKTGTTNDYRDAWFNGYNESMVTIVYVGKDNHDSLGKKETGGRVALPAWITYMRGALDGVPETDPELPPGIEVAGSYTAGGETRDEYEDVTVERIYAPQVADVFRRIDEKPKAVDDLF
ncbi:MAG: PBP1A family penicillin-binding protein [Pseudomonadota bacterium]